jgi:hypothetical protein
MGVLDKITREPARRNRTRDLEYVARIALGATGALATGEGTQSGFTIAKVGGKTGRYLVTLVDSKGQAVKAVNKRALVFHHATVETAAADAAYTAAKAATGNVRNNTIDVDGTFQIQMIRTDTFADAEVEDNGFIHVAFAVKWSSVLDGGK